MRVAVTGQTGQIASALLERGPIFGHDVIALGRPQLDLLDHSSILPAIDNAAPDVIVSAAAYTAVDEAERERSAAEAVNVDGARAVAHAARALGLPLIHISTDYVFSGSLDRPYVESDVPDPIGAYGETKLLGERAILTDYLENSAVLRVAWLYGPHGRNFVKTMLNLASTRDEVSVVSDQLGNPTHAGDVADGILQVALNLVRSSELGLRGLFHMTACGEASWADLAAATFAASAAEGGAFASVRRISTAEYPTRSARPANSRLSCDHLARSHGVVLPDWQSSLPGVVNRLTRCSPVKVGQSI